jgi:hypothetical protein
MAKGKRQKTNISQIIFAAIALLVIATMILGAIYSY